MPILRCQIILMVPSDLKRDDSKLNIRHLDLGKVQISKMKKYK